MSVRVNPYIEQNIVQPIIENPEGWGNALPSDLFGVIFSHLTLLKIQESACVNKYWNVQTINSVKADKISSLNSQISKMSELVKEQLVRSLSDSKIDQSKDLKAVISSTLEVRKKILAEHQTVNHPEIKDYLESLLKEAMDHGWLDQAMEALNLIQCDKLKLKSFATIARYFYRKDALQKSIKFLAKLNSEQSIQFAKFLDEYEYSSNVRFHISSCIQENYTTATTLNHFTSLINATNFINSYEKTSTLETIALHMKSQGFEIEGYKLECDLFEKTHLLRLLNFLSMHGIFDLAKTIVNALIFINKDEYRTNKSNDLYLKKIGNSKICNFELNLHACSLAKIGYDELSLMLADLIQDNEQKNSCHKDISIKLLEKGYVDKAIKIAIQVPAHFYKNEELQNLLILTKNLAIKGFHEKAHKIINALPNDFYLQDASDKRILLANLKALTTKNKK